MFKMFAAPGFIDSEPIEAKSDVGDVLKLGARTSIVVPSPLPPIFPRATFPSCRQDCSADIEDGCSVTGVFGENRLAS